MRWFIRRVRIPRCKKRSESATGPVPAVGLAARYIESGVIPRTKPENALHVAYATVCRMDVLLSWNFKHLANIHKEGKVLTVNLAEGYRASLRLVSPLEVEDDDN